MEFDLHIHSKYSFDSNSNINEILEEAKNKGLDGIAVADHNEIEGSLEAVSKAKNLIVIPAAEIASDEGDILGYYISEVPKTKNAIEIVQSIKEQGGIAAIAHPFFSRMGISKQLVEIVDAVETFNARHTDVKKMPLSLGEEKIVEFAMANNLSMISGSDAHTISEIGNGRTHIDNISSAEDIKKAILSGNTMVSGSKTGMGIRCKAFIWRVYRRLLK